MRVFILFPMPYRGTIDPRHIYKHIYSDISFYPSQMGDDGMSYVHLPATQCTRYQNTYVYTYI